MAATADHLYRLRAMVNEPTDATYSNEDIAQTIERYPVLDRFGNEPYTWSNASPPVATTTRSGCSASTSAASAYTPYRISTPACLASATRQSTMPMRSRRRGDDDASSTWPPGASAASRTTTW